MASFENQIGKYFGNEPKNGYDIFFERDFNFYEKRPRNRFEIYFEERSHEEFLKIKKYLEEGQGRNLNFEKDFPFEKYQDFVNEGCIYEDLDSEDSYFEDLDSEDSDSEDSDFEDSDSEDSDFEDFEVNKIISDFLKKYSIFYLTAAAA